MAGQRASHAMNGTNYENEFVRLFCEEQKKRFSVLSGAICWHPMLLRFALMLYSYSSAAYTILRDYTNVERPTSGFNMETLENLKWQASGLEERQRYVVLCKDETQIKADMVLDKRGETAIGFIEGAQWTCNDERRNLHRSIVGRDPNYMYCCRMPPPLKT